MIPAPLLALASASLTVTLAASASVAPTPTGPVPTQARPSPRSGAWPLAPRPTLVRRFEQPGSAWGPGHRGVDLLGTPGQPVHAALAGRVSFAAVLAGRGVVVVDHGGRRTTYEPVAVGVHPGQRVPAGGVLGTLVRTGSHCFPRACLHWGLIVGATYRDPLTLVGAGPVRLLPLEVSGGDGR